MPTAGSRCSLPGRAAYVLLAATARRAAVPSASANHADGAFNPVVDPLTFTRAVAATCDTELLTGTARAAQGRVFAALTADARPVAVEVSVDGPRVKDPRILWAADRQPGGAVWCGEDVTGRRHREGRHGAIGGPHGARPPGVALALQAQVAGRAVAGAMATGG
jgi:hypothetical protein